MKLCTGKYISAARLRCVLVYLLFVSFLQLFALFFCENVYPCLYVMLYCIITNGVFWATHDPLTFEELQGSSCHANSWQALQNLICSSTFEGLMPFFVADIQEASLHVNPVSWQEMSRQCDLLLDMTWNETSKLWHLVMLFSAVMQSVLRFCTQLL